MHHLAERRVREHRVHQILLRPLHRPGDGVALDEFGDLGADHVGP